MDKAFNWLVAFDVSQAVLIALALLPLHYWASFSKAAAPSELLPGPGSVQPATL
jgi:hypothetical protein